MCGIQLPAAQMVADGGSACVTVRWYCRDTQACTERWTSRRGRPAGAQGPATPSTPSAAAPGPSGMAPPRGGLPLREPAPYRRAATP